MGNIPLNIEVGDLVRPYGQWTMDVETCGTVTADTSGSATRRVYEGREPVTHTYRLGDPDLVPLVRVAAISGNFARLESDQEPVPVSMVRSLTEVPPAAAPAVWPVDLLEKAELVATDPVCADCSHEQSKHRGNDQIRCYATFPDDSFCTCRMFVSASSPAEEP